MTGIGNIKIPKVRNETERRKYDAFEVLAKRVSETIIKSPMAAKNSPITACVLLKLRLRFAKTTVLLCIFRRLLSLSSAGHIEQFLQWII